MGSSLLASRIPVGPCHCSAPICLIGVTSWGDGINVRRRLWISASLNTGHLGNTVSPASIGIRWCPAGWSTSEPVHRRKIMLIKNCWYVAANPQELQAGGILGRTILNTPVAIWRLANGQLMAALDRCPHRATPLTLGRIIENTIQCGYHGAQFDESGQCVAVPGQTNAPARGCALRLYPVVERHGFVWVWMSDAPPASLDAMLPQFAIGNHPDWHGGSGLFESLKANYKLVSD